MSGICAHCGRLSVSRSCGAATIARGADERPSVHQAADETIGEPPRRNRIQLLSRDGKCPQWRLGPRHAQIRPDMRSGIIIIEEQIDELLP
jgi:hypothetical protein